MLIRNPHSATAAAEPERNAYLPMPATGVTPGDER